MLVMVTTRVRQLAAVLLTLAIPCQGVGANCGCLAGDSVATHGPVADESPRDATPRSCCMMADSTAAAPIERCGKCGSARCCCRCGVSCACVRSQPPSPSSTAPVTQQPSAKALSAVTPLCTAGGWMDWDAERGSDAAAGNLAAPLSALARCIVLSRLTI